MGHLSKLALSHLGFENARSVRIDTIFDSVRLVPQYGAQIRREDLNPQRRAYAIDVANSMYVCVVCLICDLTVFHLGLLSATSTRRLVCPALCQTQKTRMIPYPLW